MRLGAGGQALMQVWIDLNGLAISLFSQSFFLILFVIA